MPDDAENPSQAKKGRGVPLVAIIVAAVTLLEGAGFYFLAGYMSGGPQTLHGADAPPAMEGPDPTTQPSTAEVSVLDKFRVPNNKSGRMMIYEVDLVLKVAGHRKEDVEHKVKEHSGEISDMVARVIRSAEPRVMNEDELKTLRMQLQHSFGEMLHDEDAIVGVLIPRCVPMRS